MALRLTEFYTYCTWEVWCPSVLPLKLYYWDFFLLWNWFSLFMEILPVCPEPNPPHYSLVLLFNTLWVLLVWVLKNLVRFEFFWCVIYLIIFSIHFLSGYFLKQRLELLVLCFLFFKIFCFQVISTQNVRPDLTTLRSRLAHSTELAKCPLVLGFGFGFVFNSLFYLPHFSGWNVALGFR